MQREYFCGGCGLFHWADIYKTDTETGRIDRVPYAGCPNEECVSRKVPDIPILAVDTFGFAYFADSNQDFIKKNAWSSPRYANERAIAIYEKQNVEIKE